jgi:hypothetical protein
MRVDPVLPRVDRVGGGLPLDGDQAPPTLAGGPGACPLALGVWGGGGLEGEEPSWREAAGRQPGPVKEMRAMVQAFSASFGAAR